MSVQVTGDRAAFLYDTVTGLSFGPMFGSKEDAAAFLDHLTEIGERDPRVIPAVQLAQLALEWESA